MRLTVVLLAAVVSPFALLMTACRTKAADLYDEAYRPQFHFTAKQGWLNDPNGLVYLDGQYHLFYQHNPFGTSWGNMSWGHATSPDLLHWTEQSPAIVGDPSGVKFSGTAVIDYGNTAGLQTGSTPTMALFYTSVGSFDQRMAYSTDGGKNFQYYSGNPVLGSVSGHDDRDPQVFWHEASQKWVQVVWTAAHDSKPQSFSFFGSTNLKDWSYLSETPNYFECPDFFELAVDGNPANKKWVLSDASGKYQVGTFNGTSFVPSAPVVAQQDYGANFYASQSWHDIPSSDGRRIQVTWMAGANYPGMPFNQQMGFPVELTLHNTPSGIRMFREPIAEIASLHGTEHALNNVVLTPGIDPLGNLAGDLFHIKTEIELGSATSVGFNIRGSEVRYDVFSQTLSALGRTAPLAPVNGRIDLELLVDRSSLEIFGGGGIVSMTSGFTPSPANMAIDLFSRGGNARVVTLSAFEMQSAWPAQQPAPSSGLISRWGFGDPASAAGFADSAGSNFNLANSGVATGPGGVAGNAANLAQPGDYAFVPDNSAMDANDFSVSMWIKPDANGQKGNIVSKTNSSDQGSWGVERLSDGRLNFFVQTESGQVASVQSPQAVPVGDWHHTVASYNAEFGRLELYVDGKLAASSEGTIQGAIDFDLSPFMVGQRVVGADGPLPAMTGKIDELQLYGSPLTPGEIKFLHDQPSAAIVPESYAEGSLTLQVNTDNGVVFIANSGASATSLKGYSILSNGARLNVAGWQSLEDRTSPTYDGWEEAHPTADALSELNPTGSLTVSPVGRLGMGTPLQPFAAPKFGTPIRNTDLSFEYFTNDGHLLHGKVELTGALAVNNLLLSVNPTTGAATLSNSSLSTVKLLGYTISSASGSLKPTNGNWNSLADQGTTGVNEANATTSDLSELIPFVADALVLAPGQTFQLGTLFNVAGDQDLQLELYLVKEMLPGDFNLDGTVNATDLSSWKTGFGTKNSGADLLDWQRHLGEKNPAAKPAVMRGAVRYLLPGQALTAAVPEPASMVHVAMLLGAASASRRGRPSTCSRIF